MKCGKSGFTLLECLTCLAIISLLATVVYPTISGLQDRIRFRSELTDLVSGLQQAKVAAIKSNSFIVFQVNNKGYSIFEDNGAGGGIMGDWIKQGTEKMLVDRELPVNLKLTSNFASDRTRFRGRPGMKAGTLILRSVEGKEAFVVINSIGRIRT